MPIGGPPSCRRTARAHARTAHRAQCRRHAEVLKSRSARSRCQGLRRRRFPSRRMDRQGVRPACCRCSARSAGSRRSRSEVSAAAVPQGQRRLSAICRRTRAGSPPCRAAAHRHRRGRAPSSSARWPAGHHRRAGAGQWFLTRKDAEAMRPLMEVANRHRASLFIHHGPRPGDVSPRCRNDTDNARRRNGTLDMQASLSSVMVTLCLTDFSRLPRRDGRRAQSRRQHSLRGRAHGSPLPARHAQRGAAVVALPPRKGVRGLQLLRPARDRGGGALYGAERIVCGTDGTEFGCDWTR
jgi:hypothetical protein